MHTTIINNIGMIPNLSAHEAGNKELLIFPASHYKEIPYGHNPNGKWLDEATELDALLVSSVPGVSSLANGILTVIRNKINVQSKDKRLKDTLKCILLNLYRAYLLNEPVRYSRDKRFYIKARRYGQLFFKYYRLINVIEALLHYNFICHKQAINHPKYGKQSRMWASPKLVAFFNRMTQKSMSNSRFIERLPPSEIIQLKSEKINNKSILLDYKDTNKIISMRNRLNDYNRFIQGFDVGFKLARDTIISEENIKKLYSSVVTGTVDINNITYTDNKYNYNYIYEHYSSNSDGIYNNDINNSNIYNEYYPEYNYNTKCNMSSICNSNSTKCNHNNCNYYEQYYYSTTISQSYVSISNKYDGLQLNNYVDMPDDFWAQIGISSDDNRYLNRLAKSVQLIKILGKDGEKIPLAQLGIHSLEAKINDERLYRVFNRGSFKHGGRFYGGFHEIMPKQFRKGIVINKDETVEVDYSALHIRMAYHLVGIDYRDDPYLALSDNKNDRKIFKLLALVIINACDEKKAIKAFRDLARKKKWNIPITNKYIRELFERFRTIHKPINGYLHSDAGVTMQNIDSRITEAILMRLTTGGICILPVHDSYIVQSQHEQKLKEVMEEEYEKVMKFKPIL